MEPAFILCKHKSKLYNLPCKIKANIKAKLDGDEVFVVSAKASLKDAAGLVTPVTVESPSRFLDFEIFTLEAAKALATLSSNSILELKSLEWEGLTFCTDFPTAAAAPGSGRARQRARRQRFYSTGKLPISFINYFCLTR